MSAIGRLLSQLAVIGCFLGQLSADVDLGKNCHPIKTKKVVRSVCKKFKIRADIFGFKSCTH